MANVLVLGANRGIGLELARQLAARGDDVSATCRHCSPELESLSGVHIHRGIDLTRRASLDALADALGRDSLDTLVVVAGVLEHVSLEAFDAESVCRQFKINALGPLQAIVALQDCLRDGSKVALLSSRLASITDNTTGGNYGYRMSKAALNMAGVSLARDLAARRIAVVLLHPGYVRTDLSGHQGHMDASESATGLIARIDELDLAASGSFVHLQGKHLPW